MYPPASAAPRWWTRLKYGTAQNCSEDSSSWEMVMDMTPNHMLGMRSSSRPTSRDVARS